MDKVYLWPDGEWCFEDAIDDSLWKSDDSMLLEVPDVITGESHLDAWLKEQQP